MWLPTYKFVLLVILDGWGLAEAGPGNAIALARTPNFKELEKNFLFTSLEASGEAVGLPRGVFGNSETGHYNLGAGYVVLQDVRRIDQTIKDGSFFTRPTLQQLLQRLVREKKPLHLLGLASRAQVHSSLSHLFALLEAAAQMKVAPVLLHLFTDGRDSSPHDAPQVIKKIEAKCQQLGVGQIASLCGRFWAMDRDQRWERTAAAYHLLTAGQGRQNKNAAEAINEAYQRGESDEFLNPIVIQPHFQPLQKGDGAIFFNFRFDRPRQLTAALTDPNFNHFPRQPWPQIELITLTPYAKNLPLPHIFDRIFIEEPLAAVLAEAGLKQFHIAESEKFVHVTYFFNGGHEESFPGEDWLEVPSPKIQTYDQEPEMKAREVTSILEERIRSGLYHFYLVNFANADMVGHSGNLKATIKAVETIDQCLGQLWQAVREKGGLMFITADHGNAEVMIDPQSGEIETRHNSSPVPCLIAAENLRPPEGFVLQKGILADVAPTILQLLGLEPASSMTGQNLIQRTK